MSMVAYSDLRAWISALHVQQSRGSIPAGTPTPVLPIPDPVLENALRPPSEGRRAALVRVRGVPGAHMPRDPLS